MARLGLGVGLDQQGQDVALDRVGDPQLGAVDEIVVALSARDGADALQVGAGVRLGERQAAAQLAGGETRQPVGLLRAVPNFCTMSAIIRWLLKKPVRLIHSSEMRATICCR